MITFNDLHFGPTEMQVVPMKTTRNGVRITRFIWQKLPTEPGCITTGLKSFSTEAAALATARRHCRFTFEA